MLNALCLILFCSNGISGLSEIYLNSKGEFVNKDNERVLFHGFNSVYIRPPYFNAEDVTDKRLDLFRKWGFNVIRLGVLWHPSMPSGPGKFNTTYLDAIENQVERLAKAGIYVILDMHQDSLSTMFGLYDAIPLWLLKAFPQPNKWMAFPWPLRNSPSGDWKAYMTYACQKAFQCLYDNDLDAWKHWGDFWQEVVRRFKNYTNVLGYELINEPFAGNIFTNPLRAFSGYAGKKNLLPVFDYLVYRIRQVDTKKFIFYTGVTWSVLDSYSSDGLLGLGFNHVPGGLNDLEEHKRSVYSYHYYCPLVQLADPSRNLSTTERIMCDEVLMPQMFAATKQVSAQLKSGRFLTEFGICVPDGNPNSINTVECNAVMNGADAHLQSWTYWDRDFFDAKGEPIITHVKPFARVYPQVTAGDPITLYFDVVDGSAFYAFRITNTTIKAIKGERPIVSITLPIEMHYPNGHIITAHPSNIKFAVSPENDHVIDFFGPGVGQLINTIVEINVKRK